MLRRRKVSGGATADVLTNSRRRCCICVALARDFDVKKGQIAHLDKDPANGDPANLVFLCLEHHDQYDSRPSQSKGLTVEEVSRYRAELHAELARRMQHDAPFHRSTAEQSKALPVSSKEVALDVFVPLRGVGGFTAYGGYSFVLKSHKPSVAVLLRHCQEITFTMMSADGSRNSTPREARWGSGARSRTLCLTPCGPPDTGADRADR